MNAHVSFPMDLAEQPGAGYVEISRRVALIGNDFLPRGQTARLILRAAAIQARAFVSDDDLADTLRALAAEIGQ